jgi:LytS/YehU family sensor histidine kinase
MKTVEDYVQLEKLRFEDRLSIDCAVSAEARQVYIPVMLLQTLVENAIKHGIAARPEGGTLTIRGSVSGGVLTLEVNNPRPALPSEPQAAGVGLRNAVERLRLLFGARASLHVDLSRPDIARARVRIPVSA